MTKRNGLLSAISAETKAKIGSAVIMFILGSGIAMFMAMKTGASDGSEAKRQNNVEHPAMQRQIDSLKRFPVTPCGFS